MIRMISIYKITNPSGLIYIGQTSNLKNRIRFYKKPSGCPTQPALHNSFMKYGFINHSIEVIDIVNIEEANNKEIYYIQLYDSYNNGLNSHTGGTCGFGRGENNISKRKDVRIKNSNSKKEWWSIENNKKSRMGWCHTEESKYKIKNKRKQQGYALSVYLLDYETGIYYYGIKDLAKTLDVPYKTFYNQLKYQKKYTNRYKIVYESRIDKTT